MSAAAPALLAVGLSLGLLAAAQIDRAPRLIWNASASVPVGLYVVRVSNPPSLGDLVAVRLPEDLSSWVVERGYVGADTLLLKRVAAVSGMTVCRDGLDIAIGGTVVAQAASDDRHIRPLPRWTGCVTLESDEVFLLVTGVADSLDGRYFGPLSADTILGRAIPLWTFGGRKMRVLEPGHSRRHAGVTTALVLILCMPITVAPSAVIAQDRSVPASVQQAINTYIAEAARRFGIPQPWIRAVMEVESAGNPRAVSTAGAMGLMQIMPGTWAELRVVNRLGNDPFDPRDNILAGTAYLRQMYDRFGSPGFLAAYNAGPARYQEHLDTGRALPQETRNYLAILAPLIGDGTNVARAVSRPQRTQDWRDAPLFAAMAEEGQTPGDDAQRIASDASRNGIFVPLSRGRTP